MFKQKELFRLIDELDESKEAILHYAIARDKQGRRLSGRLNGITHHASKVELIAKDIQKQVQAMRRT